MNNEELKATIENLEKTILDLKNELRDRECSPANIEEYKRWRAKPFDYYFYMTENGAMTYTDKGNRINDLQYAIGNYFKSAEEAEKYKNNLITKQKLKDIALKLNKGTIVDWENEQQNKYVIYYDYSEKMCFLNWQQLSRTQGTVYCLDENFFEIAKQEIGEEKLIELIKSGV